MESFSPSLPPYFDHVSLVTIDKTSYEDDRLTPRHAVQLFLKRTPAPLPIDYRKNLKLG